MKKLITLFIISLFCSAVYGQSIVGKWETFDDKTNEKKVLVEIYKEGNLFFAKIVKSYVSDSKAICKNCKGSKKDQPIIGLVSRPLKSSSKFYTT